MSTAKNQQASSTSQRKWLPALPISVGLVFLQVANGGLPTAVAQPPESRANDIAYLVPEIDAEWQRLRAEMGLREFTAPQETITRYQQFFEQKGVRSAATSVKVTGVIAQIYWQQLKDRKKALEIYHWALEKYAGLPIVENLRRERDMVANAPSPNDIVSIAPIVVTGQNEGKIVSPTTVTLNPSQVGAKPGVAPVTVSDSFTPVTVTAIRGQEGRGSMPVLPSVVTTLPSTELLPEVVLSLPVVSGNPLAVSVNDALRIIDVQLPKVEVAKIGAVGQETTSMLSVVNPRLAALNGYLTQWRAGEISWEKLVTDLQFQAEDVIMLTSQRGLVSMYRNDASLREKLGETMRSFPDLQQDWAKLPPTAQVILADDYVRQKNPFAKTIYETLIQSEKWPNDVWWNKEKLTYRIGLYHAAMGDYVKAAESNLEIVAFTKSNAWHDDSLIVAARYYNRAGQEEKANELYVRAEQGTHAWSIGLGRYDRALHLMAQGNHEEAQRLLKLPLNGTMADQIQFAIWGLLGRSYFETGNYKEALEALQQVVQNAEKVRFAELKDHVALAHTTLGKIEQQVAQPIWIEHREIRFVVRSGERSVRQWLKVRTKSEMPPLVKAVDERIQVNLLPETRRHGEMFEYVFGVRIANSNITEQFETTLLIESESSCRVGERVRVTIEVLK